MKIIFLIAFAFVSIAHLIFLSQKKYNVADYTKGLLMPLLAFYVASLSLPTIKNIHIIATLFFAWAGDVLLLRKTKLRIGFGALAFFVSNILWASFHFENFTQIGIAHYVFLLEIIFLYTIQKHIAKNHKRSAWLFFVYFASLAFTNSLAFANFFHTKNISAILFLLASISFITSDALLTHSYLQKQFQRSRCIVMLFYLLAQFLFTWSVMGK